MDLRLLRAGPDEIETALPLVAAFHAEEGVAVDDAHRRRALAALFTPPEPGELHLILADGRAVGYLCAAYGWSIEFGGRDAFLDELYVEPALRGRGIGREAVRRLAAALGEKGLHALHLEVERGNAAAIRLYEAEGFAFRSHYHLMSAPLGPRKGGRRGG